VVVYRWGVKDKYLFTVTSFFQLLFFSHSEKNV